MGLQKGCRGLAISPQGINELWVCMRGGKGDPLSCQWGVWGPLPLKPIYLFPLYACTLMFISCVCAILVKKKITHHLKTNFGHFLKPLQRVFRRFVQVFLFARGRGDPFPLSFPRGTPSPPPFIRDHLGKGKKSKKKENHHHLFSQTCCHRL